MQHFQFADLKRIIDGQLAHFEWVHSIAQDVGTLFVAAILLVPILIAALARRPFAALMTLLLSLVSLSAFANPATTLGVLAVACAVGSFAVAAHGVSARSQASKLRQQMAELVARVDQLESAENRRLLSDLRRREFSGEASSGLTQRGGVDESVGLS